LFRGQNKDNHISVVMVYYLLISRAVNPEFEPRSESDKMCLNGATLILKAK